MVFRNFVVVSLLFLFSLPFSLYSLLFTLYSLFRKSDRSLERDSRRASHKDVVGGFIPLDVKGTAIHLDVAFVWSATCEFGCYRRCASTCATGEGYSASSFPYSHSDRTVWKYLSELYVASLRKNIVMLKDWSEMIEREELLVAIGIGIKFVSVIKEDNEVRISH